MSRAESAGPSTRTAPAVGRRAEIAELAAGLFDARGYHNTSMENIAESVGLRKPTLYHYFKSKDEILFEIHNEMIELILSRHDDRRRAGIDNYSEALRGLMGDLVELMETHPGHLRIFFEHHRELPDGYKMTIRAKRAQFLHQIADTIQGGIAAGEFNDADVEMVTLAILGMCNWTYQWLRPGQGRTAAEVTESFWQFAMRGLAVEPSLAPSG